MHAVTPAIDNSLPCLNFVFMQMHRPCSFLNQDTDLLRLIRSISSISNDIISENQIVGFTSNSDSGAGAFFTDSIVFDRIGDELISMPGHAQRFIAKKDAGVMIALDNIGTDQVITILVTNGYPKSPVVFQKIIFK